MYFSPCSHPQGTLQEKFMKIQEGVYCYNQNQFFIFRLLVFTVCISTFFWWTFRFHKAHIENITIRVIGQSSFIFEKASYNESYI